MGAGQTGYRAWVILSKKNGTDPHRLELVNYTAGRPSGDPEHGTLGHFLMFLKEHKLDLLLSGVLPEWVELRLVTRNEQVVQQLRQGKSRSMILDTLVQEIKEITRQFKQWSVVLPPARPAQRKAA